jgi:hypothetical protein
MTVTSDNPLLERVRKLLAKAEDPGVTPAEAEAFTAKAAELMARYGIDRALLAAAQPETDHPADRVIDIANPWARVQAHLLAGLATAMRCQCIILARSGPGTRIHLFGFASDIERADMLYTSVLVQMWQGLAAAPVPAWTASPRAWRRSWLLGFTTAVISRVRAAEDHAATQADSRPGSPGPGTAVVLADRQQIIRARTAQAYPRTRSARVTYTGSGYGTGYAQGQQADLGGPRLPATGRPALDDAGR